MYRKRSPATIYPKSDRIRRQSWGLVLWSGLFGSILPFPGIAQVQLAPPNPTVAKTIATPYLDVQSDRIADMEFQIWRRINQIRRRKGLQPLQANLKLIQVARAHSQSMAQQGCYSHECSLGGTHRQRVQDAGIPSEQVAETLFKATRSQDLVNQTIQAWMQSPRHQKILLLPEASETGVAIWCQADTCYVTQNLIEPTPGRWQLPSLLASRGTFEALLKQANSNGAAQLAEQWQVTQIGQQLGIPLKESISSAPVSWLPSVLDLLAQKTGERAAILYGVALPDQLHLMLVLPSSNPTAQTAPLQVASVGTGSGLLARTHNTQVIYRSIHPINRTELLATTQQLQREVSDLRKTDTTTYLEPAQALYQWLVAPLESHLKAHQIDTLLFAMDDGLRSVPFAALHDGQHFLIEKYRMALIPSFGLTAARHTNLKTQNMLAMGISESTEGLPRLPAVPLEIATLTGRLWPGHSQATLNEQSTLTNLKRYHQKQRYGIIHLATHAEFRPGEVDNSFVQFWNRKLTLGQLRRLSHELGWQANPVVEMLVFSACQTALGNKEAELGFAGSALKAGVRSTIASLWLVNDEGSLGLMTKFYDAIRTTPTKAEAMRQAQIAMLNGELQIKDGQLQLSKTVSLPLPPELATGGGDRNFTHPYFWSGYTVVGNWY